MSGTAILYVSLFVILWIFYQITKLVRYLWKQKKIVEAVQQFPMDKKHWLRGHLDRFSENDEENLAYFVDLIKKYPKACGFYFMNFVKPYVVVYHPDTVKPVFQGRARKTTEMGMYGYGRLWFGDGVFLANGKKWLRTRRLLNPKFHFDALKRYFDVFNKSTNIFTSKLLDLAKRKVTFEIHEIAAQLTLDIILQCAFSYDNGMQKRRKGHFYIKAVDKLLMLWMKRHMAPWKHFDFIYWKTEDGKLFSKLCQVVNSFAENIIKERKKLIAEHPDETDKYHDFLDILLKSKDGDGVGLNDQEIRDEVNTFIGAGYETTSTTIAWFLYSMASYPHYQEMCQKEIDALMVDRSDNYLKWNDLQELPFLNACIKETLRLYGPPIFERELEENLMIDGKMVPAGTSVMIHLYNLHRNPEFWPNASLFYPERFLECEKIEPFAYVPFAAGSRDCMGEAFAMVELKVILVLTLSRFSFAVKEEHIPIKRLALALKSANGIYLKVSERNNYE